MLMTFYGPYGHTGVKFIPTGGVNPDNLEAYLRCEAVAAVGGTWLAKREHLAKEVHVGVEELDPGKPSCAGYAPIRDDIVIVRNVEIVIAPIEIQDRPFRVGADGIEEGVLRAVRFRSDQDKMVSVVREVAFAPSLKRAIFGERVDNLVATWGGGNGGFLELVVNVVIEDIRYVSAPTGLRSGSAEFETAGRNDHIPVPIDDREVSAGVLIQ